MNNRNFIQLVISRYNEDLEWLKDEPFSKYDIIIYNKGINDNFYSNEKTTIIKLENIGRCDATYIYHIINNYDNLANVTVFLPGSVNLLYKHKKSTQLINEIETHHDTVFVSEFYNNIKNELYDFQLDNWQSTYKKNKEINPESKLTPASIRPFGKWYESIFGNIVTHHVSYGGILGISKKDITKHSKQYYKKLYQEFDDNSSNPEVGHYFERSWEAVFYPLINPKFVSCNYLKIRRRWSLF